MKLLVNLYLIFFKMGAVCFGGGYTLLPIIKREIVEKYKYATEEEIADYFAIGQCTPGVISVNVATFVGYKLKGVMGGVFATLGFISPSVIIIGIIAAFIENFANYPIVNHAFAGIRVCVCVLIINAVLSFGKKSVVDIVTAIMCITVFILSVFTNISPIIIVIICGITGAIAKTIKEAKK